MAFLTRRSVVLGSRRSPEAVDNGMERRDKEAVFKKTDEEGNEEEEEPNNNKNSGSTSILVGNSLEIPLMDFTLSAKFANDATFPFMVMKILSTIILARGLHHICLPAIVTCSV